MKPQENPFTNRISAIEAAARRIYCDSDTGTRIARGCAAVRKDLEDILNRRGTIHPVVAVIGPKDAGKTTLCQWLIRDPENRKRLHAGFGGENATLKITWIGPEGPQDPDPSNECAVPFPADAMEDLGVPYTIVDVPGFSDGNPTASAAAARAFRLSTTVVLVTPFERLEDAALLAEMRPRDGVRVLPVVVSRSFSQENQKRMREVLAAFREKIRRVCPRCDVLAPIIVPRLESSTSQDDRRNLEESGRRQLVAAMQGLLQMKEVDPMPLAETRYAGFKEDLRGALGDLVGHVEKEYTALVRAESEAMGKITGALVGSPRQIKAACRLRLMDALVDRCPPLLFPYRTFLSLLVLAAGAWDRLVLAFLGSLPSLVMTVAQSARNAKSLAETKVSLRNEIEKKAKAIVVEKIAPANQSFLRALRQRLPEDARNRLVATPPEPSIIGLGEAESTVADAFEDGINQHAPRGWLCLILGVASSALWVVLASGPVAAVYQHFFEAWSAAFSSGHAGEAASWSDFPVPSAGMLFSTAMLVFLPVFLLAMLSLYLGVSTRRVRACAGEVVQATGSRLRDLSDNKVLRIHVEDPLRDAVRTLLDEAGSRGE